MSLFGNLFKRKNKIDERIENINLLNLSMRQNEALTEIRNLISDLMINNLILNETRDIGAFGNLLTLHLNHFQRTDEIMFMSEIAFFASTKAMNTNIHPDYLYDRLFIMYNCEDFFIDTIKECNNLQYKPLSRNSSMHAIKWEAEDILLKMRYHDLFNLNKFYGFQSNDLSFNGQEFIEISSMIDDGKFGAINKNDFAKEGSVHINRCYEFLANKYSLII